MIENEQPATTGDAIGIVLGAYTGITQKMIINGPNALAKDISLVRADSK